MQESIFATLQHTVGALAAEGSLPGLAELAQTLSLRPLGAQNRQCAQGVTHTRVTRWKDTGTEPRTQVAEENEILWVGICLHPPLPLACYISTLLHELAHCLTPPERAMVEGKWVEEPHSLAFYANYRSVLQVAERLGIFVMPPKPDKYNPRNLQRFDLLVSASQVELFGVTCPLYEPPAPVDANAQLRVVLQFQGPKGTSRKPVVLSERSLPALYAAASQKFGVKVTRCQTLGGAALTTDEPLLAMPNDTILQVCK
eukprot:TRINITY_DN1650_c0_g1_i1.p1 TRINITY_DN1650_c0_g1~~TRINITY_DN1650_c0_g1_i1.p1  ORF type:complete len:257 (+),score=29.21 TRINITY_DN1650_c0_g1_i1:40-810(+)